MDLHRMGDRRHYAAILRVFDAFLSQWEPAVAAALPAHRRQWLHARSRRAFLQQDLRALGLQTPSERVCVPELRSAAAAWGSVYVLEGSALGGQLITRRLAEAGLRPDCGAAYFHGWGEATAGLWREFRGVLEQQLDEPGAIAQACDAACATFDSLSNLLESALHERTTAA
jgi:heme oxygenase (biliverdin-IX-beta and delta-forming)